MAQTNERIESLDHAATLKKIGELLEAGRCLECETEIEHATAVGRCLYAKPCGHRIGQGDARTYNRAIARKRRKIDHSDIDTSGLQPIAPIGERKSYRRGDIARLMDRRRR